MIINGNTPAGGAAPVVIVKSGGGGGGSTSTVYLFSDPGVGIDYNKPAKLVEVGGGSNTYNGAAASVVIEDEPEDCIKFAGVPAGIVVKLYATVGSTLSNQFNAGHVALMAMSPDHSFTPCGVYSASDTDNLFAQFVVPTGEAVLSVIS